MAMQLPPLLLCLCLSLLAPPRPAAAVPSSPSSFSLDFFPTAGTAAAATAHLALSGGATTNATSGAVSMPIPGATVQYRTPVAASALRHGFSTYFSFALPPSSSDSSLAFFLTPSAASRSPPALALVFSARHVRLDLAGRTALRHPVPTTAAAHLHAWIDYHITNSSSNPRSNATDTLHVRLAATRIPTPTTANHHPSPLLSYPLHLPLVLRRGPPILAGFRTSSGNCTLFTWAFRAAPNRIMHSVPLNPTDLHLTTPPPDRVASARAAPGPDRRYTSPNPWGAALSLLLAAAAGAMLTFIVLFLWYSFVSKRRPVAPVEYPMHPKHLVYEKIVLVGVKDDATVPDSTANK